MSSLNKSLDVFSENAAMILSEGIIAMPVIANLTLSFQNNSLMIFVNATLYVTDDWDDSRIGLEGQMKDSDGKLIRFVTSDEIFDIAKEDGAFKANVKSPTDLLRLITNSFMNASNAENGKVEEPEPTMMMLDYMYADLFKKGVVVKMKSIMNNPYVRFAKKRYEDD